jgi:pimeloyl-ACP methyl ester carboxylesterase
LAGVGGLAGAAIAYKLATRASEISWEQFAEVLPHAERSQFVEVDGVKIHYQEFGEASAPPLLMIHGYSASTFSWNNVAPHLAENGFRVFVVDLIGFGFSGKPAWSDYTIDSQARMIIRFMNRLGIGRAKVVGSSYGGAVAAAVALDNPERVEKLILVGAVSNDEVKEAPLFRLATTPFLGEVIAPFLVSSKTYIKARMRNSLAKENHSLIEANRIDGVMRPLQAADAHNSLVKTLRNWHANRIDRDAHLIRQPTLLIWGEDDKVIPIHNGRKLHREITDSRLIVFRRCGHQPHEEYPEDFVDLVTDFCQTKAQNTEHSPLNI